MSRERFRPARLILAVFAAYLLVLQGVLGGMASGRQIAFAAVDQAVYLASCDPLGSGNPVAGNDGPAKLPPCCLQGCVFATPLGSPPRAAALPLAYDRPALLDAGKRESGVSPPRTDESTGRPRAPPATSLTI